MFKPTVKYCKLDFFFFLQILLFANKCLGVSLLFQIYVFLNESCTDKSK